jgi:hypothetical protein
MNYINISAASNFLKAQSPLAVALFNAKEKSTICAETIQKFSRSFFATLSLGEKGWKISQLFPAGAGQTAQTAGQTLSLTTGGAIAASLAQTFFFTLRSGFGVYKCANAIKNQNLDNAVFYGLIYTPAKIAGTLTNSMSSVQEIILLQAGHVAPIFATIGAAASLAQSTFTLISGFYEMFNACMFSKELRENGDSPTEWLFEQAFIKSNDKLDEILNIECPQEKEKAFNELLKQQKESFIRRTSPECYNEMVKHFFGRDLETTKDDVPPITAEQAKGKLSPINSPKTQEDLNKLVETVYRTNFQKKVLAAIKIISAAIACGAAITLIAFSGGLGLILVASILFAITSFLRAGSNATDLHETLGKFIWSYQKHRVLPDRLVNQISEKDQEKQGTIEQVKFVALTTLGALTFPIWLLPVSVGFQVKGVWNRMHRNKPTDKEISNLIVGVLKEPEAAECIKTAREAK